MASSRNAAASLKMTMTETSGGGLARSLSAALRSAGYTFGLTESALLPLIPSRALSSERCPDSPVTCSTSNCMEIRAHLNASEGPRRRDDDQRQANKDFWPRATAFTTRDTIPKKAHVKYSNSRRES